MTVQVSGHTVQVEQHMTVAPRWGAAMANFSEKLQNVLFHVNTSETLKVIETRSY